MAAPKILAFAGSLRKGSWNKKLVRVAADGASSAGAVVTFLDLADYPLPVFDEDLEARDGLPDQARHLKSVFLEHQGMLIGCPEYNSSVTAALKNMIDWVSRPVPGETPLQCFLGKVCGLVSASPGSLGGLRGLVHARAILGNIGVIVLPGQMAVGRVNEMFDEGDQLKNPQMRQAVMQVGQDVAAVTGRLYGS